MRRIAIIGSGQAGLLTAHGLLKAGYHVTLYSDKTADQWLNESRPTGTAGRFAPSLAYEQELGLDFWDKEALGFEGVDLVFCLQANQPFITLKGRFENRGLAIDLRLQSHRWMHELEARGGQLCIEPVTLSRLDDIAGEHDLTIVASGRGELSELFPRDEERSVYNRPQRNLAMVIVTGAAMKRENVPFRPVKFNFVAPVGEAFWVPYFHKTHGPTWNLVFEAREGGPMDKFGSAKTGQEALAAAKVVIKELFPWDWEWAKSMALADELGWLIGKFSPSVRKPIGRLPSGRIVTPIGDTSMAFDPIAGQGANNGNRMARHMVESIIAQGGMPFDETWMNATFEKFYAEHGKAAYTFTNMFLEPIPAAAKELLIAQYGSDGYSHNRSGKQIIADAFCTNFANPSYITDIFTDMTGARKFITESTGKSWVWSAVKGRAAIIKDQIGQKLGLTPVV